VSAVEAAQKLEDDPRRAALEQLTDLSDALGHYN
jgi:hypothetical protein